MRHRSRPLRLVAAALTAVVVLAACGDDDGGSAEEPVESEGPSGPDPAAVRVYSSDEVCELVAASRVGDALGTVVETAEPFLGGTPQCSYAYTTDDGTVTNVVLAVMRPVEDLGSRAGAEGYQVAIDTNLSFAGDGVVDEEVVGVGEGARWLAGPANAVLIAYQGDQVVTISGPLLTQEQAAVLSGQLLSTL